MKIIIGLFFGFLLWTVLSLLRKAVQATAHRAPLLKRIEGLLPGIALACWYSYGFWILYAWFAGTRSFPILLFLYITIPALLVSWFVLRDVIAGAVTAGRRQFRTDRNIQYGDLSGRVIGRGVTHFSVQTGSGEICRIPYSKLSGEIVNERSESAGPENFRILLRVPRRDVRVPKRDDHERIQADIGRTVRGIPWALATEAPVVELKSGNDSLFEFEVCFRSLSSGHAARVERTLRDIYENGEKGVPWDSSPQS